LSHTMPVPSAARTSSHTVSLQH